MVISFKAQPIFGPIRSARMSDSASYRSIRDQLVSITVDIEDKARVCDLLERNIEKERQLLASAETSVKEEYERILEVCDLSGL